MSEYILKHTGQQIDAAVERSLNSPQVDDGKIGGNLWSSEKTNKEIDSTKSTLLERIAALTTEIERLGTLDDSQEGENILWSSTKVKGEISQSKVAVGSTVSQDYPIGHSWIETE